MSKLRVLTGFLMAGLYIAGFIGGFIATEPLSQATGIGVGNICGCLLALLFAITINVRMIARKINPRDE